MHNGIISESFYKDNSLFLRREVEQSSCCRTNRMALNKYPIHHKVLVIAVK